jgi:type IV pilus assembly protein PilA
MKNKNQGGFSLIELLLVIVIIGVIAAIAVPSLLRAKSAAERASATSLMRTFSTLQLRFYTQHNRYGRLDELNASSNNSLGTVTGDGTQLIRSGFTFQMSPSAAPTNEELKDAYGMIATKPEPGSPTPYTISMNHTGVIEGIY